MRIQPILCLSILLVASGAFAQLPPDGYPVADDLPVVDMPSISLSGTSTYSGWDTLTRDRLNAIQDAVERPHYADNYYFPPEGMYGVYGGGAWPDPIRPNLAGSTAYGETGSALLDKVDAGDTGGPASSGIYSGMRPARFHVYSENPVAGLETIVFQIVLGNGYGDFTSAPALNLNEGGQLLTADFTTISVISTTQWAGFDLTYQLYQYQWDLTGFEGDISSLEVIWKPAESSQVYGIGLYQGDTFTGDAITSTVPEPAPCALLLLGLCAWTLRRRFFK